jgi:trimeric autotransporter adhesin
MDSGRHVARSRLARGVPVLAAAVLVPAMMAAASGRAHPLAARSSASGHAAQAWVITTVAGSAGGPARATSVGMRPCGVSSGNGALYVADSDAVHGSSGSVRRVSPATDGLTTPAGTGAPGPAGDGHPATRVGVLTCGTAVDVAGNLLLTDYANSRVRVVAAKTGTFYGQAMTAGNIYTIAGTATRGFSGDGGPATSAELNRPSGVALDGVGNLVIADSFNARVRVVAVKTGTFYGQAMTAGNIYTVAGGGTGGPGDGGPAIQAVLVDPRDPAVDAVGNLVIADLQDQRVRLVAVKTGTFYGQAMTAGHIYTVAGDGTAGFSGDGGPAASAELRFPLGVAVDGAGDLLIADGNFRVRLVAAKTGTFYGQAMTAGNIYTIAGNGTAAYFGDGGLATHAELGIQLQSATENGVAVGAAGSVLIADTGNNRVRAVAAKTGTFYGQPMTAGHIYTIVGDGTAGFSGDGGPATRAELDGPAGTAVAATGNVLVADQMNNRVRLLAAKSGTFYGQAMTAGHIYTVAGDGTAGCFGDGVTRASA